MEPIALTISMALSLTPSFNFIKLIVKLYLNSLYCALKNVYILVLVVTSLLYSICRLCTLRKPDYEITDFQNEKESTEDLHKVNMILEISITQYTAHGSLLQKHLENRQSASLRLRDLQIYTLWKYLLLVYNLSTQCQNY